MVIKFIPFILGAVSVLQATLNRQVARESGLLSAVVLNSLVLICVAFISIFVAQKLGHSEPGFEQPLAHIKNITWWKFLPGLFGFMLVAGIPFAITRVGALQVFIGLISAQMITSLIWDRVFEEIPISSTRVIGVLLGIVAAFLVSYRNY